ncbi:phage portal protein [Anaerovoracaceae bacterium 41-7]
MLTTEEIKKFLDEDKNSKLKIAAKVGQRYYEGDHDILKYRMFYYNADGKLVEDKFRSNTKIPHPFFTELVDQGTQFVLSGSGDGLIMSDDTELQKQLDLYFNKNKRFMVELSETITGMQSKGFDYMYAYKDDDGRTKFENAECLGVTEVEGRFAEDGKDQRIYKYEDRIDKDGNLQWKILVIDDQNTFYYKQTNDGAIEEDETVKLNPRPHSIYQKDGKLFTKKNESKFLPFFRLDNNKKRSSLLKPVKPLIDDYDLMASSLTNNLVDFDTPIHVVRGFRGNNLDELQKNLKTKKMIGVDEDGDVDIKTVDIPYQARKEKLAIDKEGIYQFGMGLNMAGLKDTSATTNIAIKAAYSLLELRGCKIIDQVELFLQQLVEVVLAEINVQNDTAYQLEQVWFNFKPEIMSNAQENAQIKLTEAQKRQVEINTLLDLADRLDNETLMQLICEQLDIEYEEIKSKLPDPDEGVNSIIDAQNTLNGGFDE